MGYFDDDLGDLTQKPRNKYRERQIGAFFVAWSELESQLDVSFHVTFRIDPTLAGCIYANLGTQTKIDIISSGISSLYDALGSRRVESAHRILERIRTLAERARNTLAHGQHYQYVDSAGKKQWVVFRFVARKRHSMVVHPGDIKYWKRMTTAVYAVTRAWHRKNRVLHNHLKQFSHDEMWNLSGFGEREVEPIVLRRRKPQPPKKAGSQDRPPTRGKSPRNAKA